MAWNNLNSPPQGPLIPGSANKHDVVGTQLLNSPWPHSSLRVKENQIIDFNKSF